MAPKVCILTTVHSPFDTRIFHKQAKTLVKAGYDVALIAQHEKDEVVDGIKIIALHKPRNRFTRIFGLTWIAFFLALKQKADVYHFHDPELLPAGALLRLITKKSVIYDVHENVPKQLLNKFWIPKLLRYLIAFSYRLVERVSLVFISSLIIAEDSYLENYPHDSRVLAIRNYPILLPNENFSDRRFYSAKETYLLYVGGVSVIRGAFELIKTMHLLTIRGHEDIKLVVGGPFLPPALEQEISRAVVGYGLKDSIKFLGNIPYTKVSLLLSQSNIGLAILHPNPNYIESLPTKLFEYMMAGLPVIVSNFPLWRKIVEDNKCGLCVDPLSPEDIADAIEWLVSHPKEARHMGKNGRRIVEEKYNWEKEAKKLLTLYEGLLR